MANEREIVFRVRLATSGSVADIEKLKKSFESLSKVSSSASPQQRAAAQAQIEQERRITATTRAEAQARVAVLRSEGQQKVQAARADAQTRIEQERRLTAQIQAEQRTRQQSVQSSVNVPQSIGGSIVAGAVGFLGIQGVQAVTQQAIALGDLQVRVGRATKAFEILSGGANQARERLDAIKAAAGGAVTSLQAIEIGTQASSLGLAKTSEEFAKLTVAARAIAFISPTIKDVGTALTELALFSSNAASFARADQLGLGAGEVRERMRELREEFPLLDDSQLKLQASIEILNQKYGVLLSTTEALPSGLERARVALSELRTEAAEPIGIRVNFIAGEIADVINTVTEKAFEQNEVIAKIQRTLPDLEAQNGQPSGLFGMGGITDNSQVIASLKQAEVGLKNFQTAIGAGVPGLEKYQEELGIIAVYTADNSKISEEWAARVVDLSKVAADAVTNIGAMASTAEDFASATLSPDISKNIEQIRQQRELIQTFKDLDVLIADTGAFTPAQIPGIDQLTQDLISLKAEIASSGQVTEEQAAALAEAEQYFNSAAAGASFLANAENAAAVASGQMNAQLATMPGFLDAVSLSALRAASALQSAFAIEARATSSLTSGLSGLVSRGLINAQQAEQIYSDQQLKARQGAYAIANSGGTETEQAFAQAELQRQLEAPIRAIEETERLRIENERKAAAEAERAMKAAAKGTQKAFEDVAKNLESDLRGIPGLFGTSDVTEADMQAAADGRYKEKPDEWLRQLRDEVENGKDYEGVSIEQAREALARVGIDAAENAEDVLAQIEEAWNNSTLFADKANLELINQEAVQAQLDLQEKARQGQQNILDFFGVTVDGAVAAITGGSVVAPEPPVLPEVKAPEVPSPEEFYKHLIGAPPKPADAQQLAADGGSFSIDQITLAPNLGADIAADIATQLSEQESAFSGQGGGIAMAIEAGFKEYQLSNHAQTYYDVIRPQFSLQVPQIKGMGGGIAMAIEAGYGEYTLSNHAQTYYDVIRPQFSLKVPDHKGLGGGVAMAIEAGYKEYTWTDMAGEILGELETQFAVKETIERAWGVGGTVASELAHGMTTIDYAVVAKSILTSLNGGFNTEENFNFLYASAGGLMNIIRDGMRAEASKPGWAQSLFNDMMSALLDAASDSIEAEA